MASNTPVGGAHKQPTAAEIREWYNKNRSRLEKFEQANDAIKNIRDIQKSSTHRTISNFNKESLRNYLRNPSSNEANLRNLSRYLSYRSQVYYKLLMYNANMFSLDSRMVIPQYSLTEDNDKDSILQSYQDTLLTLEKMGLQLEFLKACFTCFREDVFYGCCYYDDGSDYFPSMFFLPLDPDYCKIQGYWENGTLAFAMDMSYFRRNQDLLEYWGEPFDSMYREYQSTNEKWVTMPEEYSICLKYRIDDLETIIPVFSGVLNGFISLIDQEDIQAIAEEQSIYKMIWLEMETLNGSSDPDDWKVDPDIMIDYYNKMNENLPEYVSTAIVPGKLNAIEFNNDQSTDTNKIQKSTQNVLNTSGGAQILNSADLSTSAAFNAVVKADTEFAISTLLPQIQSWVNGFLTRNVSNPCRVKFFEVSVYTKKDLRDELLENAQNGLPTKLAINSMSGISELDTIAMNFLEEDVLSLSSKLVPLSTSYTQSSNDVGGQEKDPEDLTDAGQRTRDEDLNGK